MQRLVQFDIFIYLSFQIPFEMIENTNKMQNKSHTFIIMQAELNIRIVFKVITHN